MNIKKLFENRKRIKINFKVLSAIIKENITLIAFIGCIALIGVTAFIGIARKNNADNQQLTTETGENGLTYVDTYDNSQSFYEEDIMSNVLIDINNTPSVTIEKQVIAFVFPVTNGYITKNYSRDNLIWMPSLGEWTTHMGIDIAGPANSCAVASSDGEIVEKYTDPLLGVTVIIKHDEQFITKYSSLSDNVFVEVGDIVKQGDLIGEISNSAISELDQGNHLHFEILKEGENVDPTDFVTQ